MIKTGEVKQHVTRCDFCSKPAEDIDDDGVARCEDHAVVSASKKLLKASSDKFHGRYIDKDDA